MLVHGVMSTGLVTAKKTDTVRSVVMKMMTRQCMALPVVEGDNQLVGMGARQICEMGSRNLRAHPH